MAAITHRESGRWQARIRKPGLNGSETFRTRIDAEAWARKVESELERGIWRDSAEADRTTLTAALSRYGREITAHKRSRNREDSILRIWGEHKISKLALSRINGESLAKVRDEWTRLGYAPATILRRFSVLSHLFAIATKEWGMVTLVNPVRLVRLDQVNNERTRRVSGDELDAICSATGSPELGALARLAVETAMRRGELCGLRWEHIDLQARTAHLPHTKNGHTRDVPLSTHAVTILRDLPRRIDGAVFGMRPDSVSQAFNRAVKRAGLEDLHFHDLRHEATSRLAEVFQAHELAKITGHRDLRMVLRYYHPRAADLAKKLG